jgi:hypothetical protein
MRGALPLLSLYVFMEWTGVTSAFTEHLLSLENIRYFIIVIIIIVMMMMMMIFIIYKANARV